MEDEYIVDMLIVEDILKFLYLKYTKSEHLKWKPEFTFRTFANGRMKMQRWYEELGFPQYDQTVGLAVKNIMDMKKNYIIQMYKEFLELDVVNGIEFANHALRASPIFFPEGYNNGGFLGYCAAVMGVALCYLRNPPNDVLQYACGVVAQVLFSHQITDQFYEKGAWLGLYSTSKNFNELVADN
ncbi:hypothetical protein HNY73_008710 [Argiope bruennichi]|uniref:Uncharacterized protein n=1 Tax=Argiope bruennichi TaxID=94029 RepID=A0A8T0FCB8_ARGBR|nr:hypothetical protein HNY73_008710 [Argiope bruennichi]